ncbi:hypothetical protein GH810_06535 [Acetobacterium paludosum]|uniref:YcxB-like protein domain-containing protein n=1 Tax=Acetobacterium paludosum TaxID=52693 RepID=A0A923HVE8_9FIRM|nr:hypothetical protein [Acetobacterium paludosum]MBC3887965.1 hypothetical protein [Acetobacterium paludosum]
MEPKFIVQIDCTKKELLKACYDYRYEAAPLYKYLIAVALFCFAVNFFPSLYLFFFSSLYPDYTNIFLLLCIPLCFLAMLLYVLNIPRIWQYRTIGTQYNVTLKKLFLLKKSGTTEDLERIRIIKKGHISGTLNFYPDHFEYSDILNNTYLVQYIYEKDDHFIVVCHAKKMVLLIKKSLFLKGTPEEFRTFLDEKYQAVHPGEKHQTAS